MAALAACGEVKPPPDAPPAPDAPGSVAFRGMPADTMPVTFGGPFGGMNYCTYTIVLKQIEFQLAVLPSGAIVGATAQNLNVEAVVEPCGLEPQKPSIAKYTFAAARSTPPSITVELVPAMENEPQGTLTLKVQRAGDQYMTDFEYVRTDLGPPFDWHVAGTVMMAR